jgi:hypothetical protein
VTNVNIFAIEVHLIPCDRYQEFEKAAKEGRFRAEVSPPFRHVWYAIERGSANG